MSTVFILPGGPAGVTSAITSRVPQALRLWVSWRQWPCGHSGLPLLQPRVCGGRRACLSGAAPGQGGLQTPGSNTPVLGFFPDPITSAFE